MNKFNTLNIEEKILKGLEKKDFEEMTEVQEKVIPLALQGVDIIAQAPTGTGKTAAFAIPLLEKINMEIEAPQVLVLSPTRELAVQITNEIEEMGHFLKNVKVVAIYGGEYIEKQITALKRKPQIIVATPGRLLDHINRRTIRLNNISTLVLDEADEMLNMGFKEDIEEILSLITLEHQTMLFSATISPEIERIAKKYLINPTIIRINKNELTISLVEQKYIEVNENDKIEVISRLIDINNYKLVMIFCNTKKGVDEVCANLMLRGVLVEALHGDMKQMQRDRVMNRFRNGLINVLVASDVAARGLDIDDVDVVFNYDLPTDDEYYVHRIGRTGRANKEGIAISLVTKKEKYRLRQIMAYAKTMITAMEIPSIDKVMTVRVHNLLNKALEVDTTNSINVIKKEINNIISKDVDVIKLLSGLISLQLNLEQDANIEMSSKENKKTSRVFFGMGRKDGVKVYEITDLITKKTKIKNSDIDDVDLHENFTFLNIPSKYLDELIFAFTTPVNGRKIIVEEAKVRKDNTSKRRDGRRGTPRKENYRNDRRAPRKEMSRKRNK